MAMLNACIHLGFSNAAGTSLIAQGFAAPEDLEQLTSKEGIGLCKSLRLPGGLIPNPVAIIGVDGALPPGGVPLFVANPGETVCAMAEKSLKQAIYFVVCHGIRISCPCSPVALTLPNVRRLFQLRKADETGCYVEPDKPCPSYPKLPTRNYERKWRILNHISLSVSGLQRFPSRMACGAYQGGLCPLVFLAVSDTFYPTPNDLSLANWSLHSLTTPPETLSNEASFMYPSFTHHTSVTLVLVIVDSPPMNCAPLSTFLIG